MRSFLKKQIYFYFSMCAPKCKYVHYMYAGVPHRGQKSALDSLEPPIVSSLNPQAIAPASNRSSYMAIGTIYGYIVARPGTIRCSIESWFLQCRYDKTGQLRTRNTVRAHEMSRHSLKITTILLLMVRATPCHRKQQMQGSAKAK